MLEQLTLPETVTFICHPYGKVILGDLREEIHGPTSYDRRVLRTIVGTVIQGTEITALWCGVPLCQRNVAGEQRSMWGVTQKELDVGLVERTPCG